MKNKIIVLLVLLCGFYSCKNADEFTDVIYFTGTEKTPEVRFTVDEPTDMAITLTASDKVSCDTKVVIKESPELLETYNKKFNKSCKLLPAGSYSLTTKNILIKNGNNISEPFKVGITSLEFFKEGDLYCLPISIVNSDGEMSILETSRTVFVIINQTIITNAMTLNSSYCKVAYDNKPELSAVPNVSMEARIYINSFQTRKPYISTVMGIEENFLLRFGNTTVPPNQIQLAGGPYPLTSSYEFAVRRWYHVAVVYDGASIQLYIDGELSASTSAPRGPIDLSDAVRKGFNVGCSAGARYLDGVISEARVWTKALSQMEIKNNMCYVNPASPALLSYWKFNEGEGKVITDWSGQGYNLTAAGTPIWVKGIRCPN